MVLGVYLFSKNINLKFCSVLLVSFGPQEKIIIPTWQLNYQTHLIKIDIYDKLYVKKMIFCNKNKFILIENNYFIKNK